MEEKNRERIRNILLFISLILLFIGMAAVSFILLHHYAEYGREVSVNMAESRGKKDDQKQETASAEGQDKKAFLKKLEPGRTIRVQLLGDEYLTEYHETLAVTAESGLVVSRGKRRQVIPAGETFRIFCAEEMTGEPEKNDEIRLAADQKITLEAADKTQPLILPELVRGQESPSYEGKIEVSGTEKGLLVVNEVDLETYLQSVVSSEMPSSYPLQALCAQAICARTYAVNCINQSEGQKKTADLDDSTSWQVYNNYPGDELSAQAVHMTEGLIMDCSDVYYYSTSCLTEGRTDLGNEENFRKFLDAEPEKDAEYGSPWVRWSVELPEEQILDSLKKFYGCEWKKLQQVKVRERSPEGQVQSLSFSNGSEEILADGEYQIRCVLGCARAVIRLMDGSRTENLQLLPSAYFYIKKNRKKQEDSAVFICGGGYGHGIGMSQNGAAAMAREGAGYEEILKYYYS